MTPGTTTAPGFRALYRPAPDLDQKTAARKKIICKIINALVTFAKIGADAAPDRAG
ncbi:hypothetical protein IQ782_17170 [Salipiger pacificus]|uniref:Uncharacterized protein n=1 Tax=Salipiger mangrovisoli TaxID=2865933 RepID=A0ABR9X4R7_9RHOB|nr:hypothetical protein [Salipiger mangrovisoli]